MGDTVVTVVALARTTIVAVSFAALTLRVRRPAAERSIWRSYQFGIGTLLFGSALDTVLTTTGSRSRVGDLVLTLSAQAVCFFFYRALVHWNRARTSTSGTGRADWLLGLGAAAAFTGTVLTTGALTEHDVDTLESQLVASTSGRSCCC